MVLSAEQQPLTSETVRCPRCGYDQRGIVATWTQSSPLTGTCAECGLVFRWAEVLQPERFEPQWCVEYAAHRRALPRTVLSTVLRSFWPWGFWSRLQMSHRIRWRRLIGYVLLLHLLLLVGYVFEQTAVAVRVRWAVEQEMVRQRGFVAMQLQQLQQGQQSESWGFLDAKKRLQLQQYIQRFRRTVDAHAVNHSYAAAIIEAVLDPFGITSRGTVNYGRGLMPYPAPGSLHDFLDDRTGIWGRSPTADRIIMSWGIATWLAIAYPLLPLGFVCLPISRKRAKVRWGHIARVTAYGFFIIAATGLALSVFTGVGYAPSSPSGNPLSSAGLVLACTVAPVAVILWWAVAIKRYLRLPHGWAVALLLGVIAALLPLVLVAILEGALS